MDDFKSNLEQIIERSLTRVKGESVLLMTPPPVDMTKVPSERYDPEQTKLYARAVQTVGKKLGIPVADVWSYFMSRADDFPHGLADLLKDGIHLTPQGNDLVAQIVQDTLRNVFPEIQKRLEQWVVARSWREPTDNQKIFSSVS